MKKNYPEFRLGILGGGQLARMMVLQGHKMGLQMHVLSPSHTDPAAQVTAFWHPGDIQSEKSLKDFLKAVDLATFESEFLDGALLQKLTKETRTPVQPKPQLMRALQDRLSQKKSLAKHKLPMTNFLKVATVKEAQRAFDDFEGQVVFKKRLFGYDGHGTFVVRNQRDLDQFLPTLASTPQGFIAEEWIDFRRELAISAVRNATGDVEFLPLVETFQENSRCLWARGPVSHKKVTSLKKTIKDYVTAIRYQGILTFELFDSKKGLLVNEVAPRVHNSAHYSLDGLTEDQFTLHLRSILNLQLKAPKPISAGFAMMNLLGEGVREFSWEFPGPTVKLHWYGKEESRPGRKMGHVNARGSSASQALTLVKKARGRFRI